MGLKSFNHKVSKVSSLNESSHMMRTRSDFKNEFDNNKVQFPHNRDENVNFCLCEFQN